MLERGEVCAQLIELGKPGYDISRSQRDFGFNQSGLGARRDVDVRFTRWPHELHKEGTGTKVVVERSSPGLVCIERLARGAATDAHRDTRIVGAEEIQTNEAFAIARHPSTGAVVQSPDLVVAQRLGVEHRELEVVWNYRCRDGRTGAGYIAQVELNSRLLDADQPLDRIRACVTRRRVLKRGVEAGDGASIDLHVRLRIAVDDVIAGIQRADRHAIAEVFRDAHLRPAADPVHLANVGNVGRLELS